MYTANKAASASARAVIEAVKLEDNLKDSLEEYIADYKQAVDYYTGKLAHYGELSYDDYSMYTHSHQVCRILIRFSNRYCR